MTPVVTVLCVCASVTEVHVTGHRLCSSVVITVWLYGCRLPVTSDSGLNGTSGSTNVTNTCIPEMTILCGMRLC